MALTEVDAARLNDNVFNATGPYTNRIINGDMRIDQRNAGASVTITTLNTYTIDRWTAYTSASSKFSVQQNAGAVTPPVGFTNYLGLTSLAATTVGSGDYYYIMQAVEGFNAADLAWGTANAQTISVSFWVRSSLTGTFGAAVRNNGTTRTYPFEYTISSANTWEYKTIQIPGDTSGTWLTNNSVGLYLNFSIGMGSTYAGTANTWAAANYASTSGSVNLVATNGATFYITGVQLEAGSVATPFERRSYGQELSLCQRYCVAIRASEGDDGFLRYATGDCPSTGVAQIHFALPVQMRTRPTSLNTTGTAANYAVYHAGSVISCSSVPTIMGSSHAKVGAVSATVAPSSLTAGGAAQLISNSNTTSYLIFNAEL